VIVNGHEAESREIARDWRWAFDDRMEATTWSWGFGPRGHGGGGEPGLGYACALELAREGASLSICRETVAASTRRRADPSRDRFRRICDRADVSKQDDCVRFTNETLEHFGRLDILVTNAVAALAPWTPSTSTTCATGLNHLDERHRPHESCYSSHAQNGYGGSSTSSP